MKEVKNAKKFIEAVKNNPKHTVIIYDEAQGYLNTKCGKSRHSLEFAKYMEHHRRIFRINKKEVDTNGRKEDS